MNNGKYTGIIFLIRPIDNGWECSQYASKGYDWGNSPPKQDANLLTSQGFYATHLPLRIDSK
jgi:hypothetical protein